jgi:hypothetical protein
MRPTYLVVTASLLAAAGAPIYAQGTVEIRAAGFYESYAFDTDVGSLQLKNISEMAVPVGVDVRLGRVGTLALSSGWANVQLTSKNPSVLPDQTISGIIDTEARLSLDLIPGRLMLLMNGAIPTGVKTVTENELAILGALTSDIIGFSAPQLGSGGNVGGGFAGAVPVGRFAIGLGGTYRLPLTYVPVSDRAEELKPGQEFRFRAGLEGPIGRRSYIRFAGIYAMRSKDEIDAELGNGVGNRIVGYLSLNQGVGSSTLILYGFDVFRSDPQIEPTATGAAVLPKGNLTAAGMRWTFPLAPGTSLGPRAEFRYSLTANSETDVTLRKAGQSIRAGLDLRRQVNQQFAIVLQADGVTGKLADIDRTMVGIQGFRVALHTEITP